MAVISTILSFSLLIHSSALVILLLIPSRVFFIPVLVLFISASLFFSSPSLCLNIFRIFLTILFLRSCIFFTIIILNSFSGRLLIPSSFSCSYRFLSCTFMCSRLLCCLIFSDLLCLLSPFCRLQECGSSCFWCLLLGEWGGCWVARLLPCGCHWPVKGMACSIVVKGESAGSVS